MKAVGQLAGGGFDTATEAALDVDEWLRAYAASALVNPGDNYAGDNAQHNLMLYTPPAGQKTLFFIRDADFVSIAWCCCRKIWPVLKANRGGPGFQQLSAERLQPDPDDRRLDNDKASD